MSEQESLPVPVVAHDADVSRSKGYPVALAQASQGHVNPVAAIRRRWLVAALLAMAVCAVGLPPVWLLIKPLYTATGAIEIAPAIPQLVYKDEAGPLPFYTNYVNTQARLVTSSRVLYPALEDPVVRSLAYVKAMKNPVAELQKRLEAKVPPTSQLVLVSMTGEDANAVAEIVNVVIRNYMGLEGTKAATAEDVKLRTLQRERDAAWERLENLHNAQRELGEEFGTVDLSRREKIMLERLQALQEEATRLETSRIALEARKRIIGEKQRSAAAPTNLSQLAHDYVAADPLVGVLGSSIAELKQRCELAAHEREEELRARIGQKQAEYEQAAINQEKDLMARIAEMEQEYERAALSHEADLSARILDMEQRCLLAGLRWTDEAPQMKDMKRALAELKRELAELQKKPAEQREQTPDMRSKSGAIAALKKELEELRRKPAEERHETPEMRTASQAIETLQRELQALEDSPTGEPYASPEKEGARRAWKTLSKALAEREGRLREEFKEKELKFLKDRAKEQREAALQDIEDGLTQLAAHEKRIGELIDKQDTAARSLGRRALAIKKLELDIAFANDLYQTLRQRIQALQMERQRPVARIRVAYEADVPRTPSRDERRKYSVVLVTAALFFGGAFVVFLQRVRPRVESPLDAETECKLRVLGTTPRFKDLSLARVERRHLMDDCQTIWVNLMLAARGDGARTLVIASPAGREGKTTLAINLATYMALTGKRVLLIDGDLRKPEIARYIKVDDAKGITNVLAGECSLEEAIQATPLRTLDILPGDHNADRKNGPLTNGALAEALVGLKARYDAIVIDTSAVLAMPDARLWASASDGVMLVARSGRTGVRELSEADARMQQAGAKILGVVITDVRVRDSYDYYHESYAARREGRRGSKQDAEVTKVLILASRPEEEKRDTRDEEA